MGKYREGKRREWHIAALVITVTCMGTLSRLNAYDTSEIIDAKGRIIRLPYLPIDAWYIILKHLNCGDFGPLALPAP